jgi:hypothetical protein
VSELERRLRSEAPYYPFPPTPAVSREVLGRLPQRRPFPWRRAAVAVAVAVVAVAAAIALTPPARSAFLDWLDAIPGVKIARGERLPQSELLPAFDFGRPVSLEEARRAAKFPVRFPEGVGDPTRTYLDHDGVLAQRTPCRPGAPLGPRGDRLPAGGSRVTRAGSEARALDDAVTTAARAVYLVRANPALGERGHRGLGYLCRLGLLCARVAGRLAAGAPHGATVERNPPRHG